MQRPLLIFGALAIALVTATACAGAQPATGGAPSTLAPVAAPSTTTPAAASTPTAAPSSGPSITDVLKAGKLATYKVTYKWTIVTGGQTIDSQQTWFYKPPKARFDYALGQGAGSFSMFVLEDGTYICTSAGGTSFCQKSPQQAAVQQNPAADFDLQLNARPDQFNATYQGARSIAGQQAQCYSVKSVAATAFGDVTSCYSATGVPLLTQMRSPGSDLTMEATAFSTTVTDADFTLPAAAR